MRRLSGCFAAASMFLFASLAEAEEARVLTMKAELRADWSTGKELSFVYISGDSIYPDGTMIFVGVQALNGFKYLKTVSCYVEKGRFLAEIGPWEQHFPAGRYHVVAEFRFEDQSPEMQARLGTFRDMEKCIKDNADFAAEYDRDNPVRAKMFRDYIAKTGRCPGKTGNGDTWLVVGSVQEAVQALEIEKDRIRSYAEAAARLAATLATFGASSDSDAAASLAAWRAEWTELDSTLRNARAAVLSCGHAEAAASVEAAFFSLEGLAGDVEALAVVRGPALRRDIESLESKGDAADKDERRRLARLNTELASLESSRSSHARSVAQSIAEALYGPQGLEPAPARLRVHVRELLEPFGIEPAVK